MMQLHPAVKAILDKREIKGEEQIMEFLAERPKLTHDPFLLKDAEAGVDFLLAAIDNEKKICIYGDYDADGITATALMVQVLSNLTDNISWYIPSRFDEGYGLNKDAIKTIHEQGNHVIVTVDCGSVSAEEVEYAKEIGLEIMVTDHHNLNDKPADCLLINPKQPNETYPFSSLAGCGVAFKTMQIIQRKRGLEKRVINQVLDLVAIATIADIVPLLDENRTLTKYGISCIRQSKRKGLVKLIEKINLDQNALRSEHIAYIIAPHINAAGRMGDAGVVVDLLLEQDDAKAEELAARLVSYNGERKKIQQDVYEICTAIVDEKYKDEPIYLINAGDAHEGITGIVAGKIRETYNKPAIILTNSVSGDVKYLKGTGRSMEGIDLYELLSAHSEMFEKFGGHAMACGFLMRAEHEDTLRTGLIHQIKQMLNENPKLLDYQVKYDICMEPSEITKDLIMELTMLEPFGSQNEEPAVCLSQVSISQIKFMGNDNQHVRFNAGGINCVFFGRAHEKKSLIESGELVSVIGYPYIDNWNNQERIQFRVSDICQ